MLFPSPGLASELSEKDRSLFCVLGINRWCWL